MRRLKEDKEIDRVIWDMIYVNDGFVEHWHKYYWKKKLQKLFYTKFKKKEIL